jgi:glycosyltransferase involved in cell wall biosynthesis
MPPAVSVIIPCHNHGQFLDEAVDSVLAQTFTDYEIVIVDDGSDDPLTVAKLAAFSRPRCRVLRSPHLGLVAARNLGIRQSAGRCLLPLDADDRLAPTYLEKTVPRLDGDATLGIITTEAEFFGSRTGRWMLAPCHLPDLLLRPGIFATALFRRADWVAAGGYQPDMVHGYEDYDLWLAILKLGRKAHRVPEVLFYYRQGGGGMLAGMDLEKKVRSYLKLYEHHRELYHANMDYVFRTVLELAEQLRARRAEAVAQIYLPDAANYSERFSVQRTYARGDWIDLRIELPEIPPVLGPVWRIDPGCGAGIFEISRVRIMSPEGTVRFTADGTGLRRHVSAGGTALLLSNAEHAVLVSYGSDPQLLLAPVGIAASTAPLVMELRLRAAPDAAGADEVVGRSRNPAPQTRPA